MNEKNIFTTPDNIEFSNFIEHVLLKVSALPSSLINLIVVYTMYDPKYHNVSAACKAGNVQLLKWAEKYERKVREIDILDAVYSLRVDMILYLNERLTTTAKISGLKIAIVQDCIEVFSLLYERSLAQTIVDTIIVVGSVKYLSVIKKDIILTDKHLKITLAAKRDELSAFIIREINGDISFMNIKRIFIYSLDKSLVEAICGNHIKDLSLAIPRCTSVSQLNRLVMFGAKFRPKDLIQSLFKSNLQISEYILEHVQPDAKSLILAVNCNKINLVKRMIEKVQYPEPFLEAVALQCVHQNSFSMLDVLRKTFVFSKESRERINMYVDIMAGRDI